MLAVVDLLLALFQIATAAPAAEPPPRRPPVRWRVVGILWLALLGAVPVGLALARLAPGAGGSVAVAWIMAAAVVLLLTVSCIEVALTRPARRMDRDRSTNARP